MGYRSDVAIAMYAMDVKDAPTIKLWIKENFPMPVWVDETENVRWFDRGMIFNINGVKWYDDYEDIKAVHDALGAFEELFVEEGDTPEGAYEFIRIGEDDDDTVQRRSNNSDYVLSLERNIYIGD
jgi:hypothetical protein